MPGVLEVAIGGIVVADVRPAAGIQGKGRVEAHTAGAVYRLDLPGCPVMVCIQQVPVAILAVADMAGDWSR